jgi:hypothetical protein
MTKSITVAERQTRDFAEKKYTVGSRSRRLGLAGCELAASESGGGSEAVFVTFGPVF